MTGERLGDRAALMLAAYQRIAAKMYTLDAHAGRRFLKDERLSGTTAATARRVNARAAVLWSRFDELRRLSDQIPAETAGLGDTARAKLATLLGAACVKLDAAGIPALASGDAVASEVALSDFAEGIETEGAELLAECASVDSACGEVADVAAAITAGLADAAERAGVLGLIGEASRPATEGLAATLASLRARRVPELDAALTDPVAAARERWLDGLAAEVDALARRLAEWETGARELPERIARVRRAVTELAESEAATAERCELAAAKIAAPPPPRFRPVAERLAERLRGLEERDARTEEAAPKYRLAEELAELDELVRDASRDCARAADGAGALLDRRTELRGRLAAYSRKAARIGVIENPRVAASAEVARRLLSLAPCDLRAATSAVRQFQQEISGAQEAPA